VAEKKFPMSPVPSATVGKAFVDDLIAFAESFRLSAKPGFPVVQGAGPTEMAAFCLSLLVSSDRSMHIFSIIGLLFDSLHLYVLDS
jgi:hypothetical protein